MTLIAIQNPQSRIKNPFIGVVRLLRPGWLVVIMMGVALGGVLVAGAAALEGNLWQRLLLAMCSQALIGGAAFSLNDLFDLATDQVRQPERPLASGVLSPKGARWVWGLGSAVGVALGGWLSVAHGVMAAVVVFLLYAYSAHLKRTVLVGNLVVALVAALALVYGGWAVGTPAAALIGAAFAFLTVLAYEVVQDLEVTLAEPSPSIRTLPAVHGPGAATRTATVLLACTIILAPLPFLFFNYGGLYLLLALLADGLFLSALWQLQARPSVAAAQATRRLLAWAMLLGLSALTAGGMIT